MEDMYEDKRPAESMTAYGVRMADESAQRMLAKINGTVETAGIKDGGVSTMRLETSGLVGVSIPSVTIGTTIGNPISMPATSVQYHRPQPHLCPKCDGECHIARNDYATTAAGNRECPVCKGAGVLWG